MTSLQALTANDENSLNPNPNINLPQTSYYSRQARIIASQQNKLEDSSSANAPPTSAKTRERTMRLENRKRIQLQKERRVEEARLKQLKMQEELRARKEKLFSPSLKPSSSRSTSASVSVSSHRTKTLMKTKAVKKTMAYYEDDATISTQQTSLTGSHHSSSNNYNNYLPHSHLSPNGVIEEENGSAPGCASVSSSIPENITRCSINSRISDDSLNISNVSGQPNLQVPLDDSFKKSAKNEMRELRKKLRDGNDDLSILDNNNSNNNKNNKQNFLMDSFENKDKIVTVTVTTTIAPPPPPPTPPTALVQPSPLKGYSGYKQIHDIKSCPAPPPPPLPKKKKASSDSSSVATNKTQATANTDPSSLARWGAGKLSPKEKKKQELREKAKALADQIRKTNNKKKRSKLNSNVSATPLPAEYSYPPSSPQPPPLNQHHPQTEFKIDDQMFNSQKSRRNTKTTGLTLTEDRLLQSLARIDFELEEKKVEVGARAKLHKQNTKVQRKKQNVIRQKSKQQPKLQQQQHQNNHYDAGSNNNIDVTCQVVNGPTQVARGNAYDLLVTPKYSR